MTLERWKRATEWPLTAAALIFLGLYALVVIADLHPPADAVPRAGMWAIWGVFLVNYVVSLALAPSHRRWFVRHLPDLALVVLPFLGPLRLLRLVILIKVLQHAAGNAFRGRVAVYLTASAALFTFVGALAVLEAERHATGATIRSFGDAMWWSVVTITTVGYGDLYPVTVLGRLLAAVLMVVGIALLGGVTGAVASWFVDRANAQDEQEEREQGPLPSPGLTAAVNAPESPAASSDHSPGSS